MNAFTFLKEHTPLFAGVADARLEALAAESKLAAYASGKTVLFQGMTVDGLYVLCTGKLSVQVKQPGKGLKQVAELNPGEVFGETSIYESGIAGASIKAAADDTHVLVIPQDAFRRLLVEDPGFGERVKALIASRRPPAKGG